MMPVVGKKIRDKMGLKLSGKRRDIILKVHRQNPAFCGISEPLGEFDPSYSSF